MQVFVRDERGWRLRTWLGPILAAGGTALVTGGIWLVRNAWWFKQPVEFVSDRYYVSILADLRDAYGGDWLYLLWRTRMKARQWLGPWFPLLGVPVAWLAVETAILTVRRPRDPFGLVRAWFLGSVALVAAVHVAGLVGAPWTSLEFTNGLSLRYVLPLWILAAVFAYVAVFSRSFRWYGSSAARAAAWTALAAATLLHATRLSGPGGLPLDLGLWPSFGATAAALAVLLAIGHTSGRPRSGRAGIVGRVVPLAVLGVVVWTGGSWLNQRHAVLTAQAEASESAELEAWLEGRPPAVDPSYRRVFLAVRVDEARRGADCRSRRFFVASRFDAPLALQPSTYTSVLVDSRRSIDAVLGLLRHAPPAGTCDYMVVSREESSRVVVQVSETWLVPIESGGPYLVYRIRRP